MAARLSRFVGGLRIGPDFFERVGAVAPPAPGAAEPRGVVDRMADLASPSVDPDRVHPAIARFFDDTASLELRVVSRWRFPASIVWPLARRLMRALGQFVLPQRTARIATRVARLDPAADGRDGIAPRAVVRTYEGSGEVMQAVAYGTARIGDASLMSAVFPMPGGHVWGRLRLVATGEDSDGRVSVALTSDGPGAGVFLVIGGLALPSPFAERLALWSPEMSHCPADLDPSVARGASVVGRHEQRFFGFRFVVHDYGFTPRGAPGDHSGVDASPSHFSGGGGGISGACGTTQTADPGGPASVSSIESAGLAAISAT